MHNVTIALGVNKFKNKGKILYKIFHITIVAIVVMNMSMMGLTLNVNEASATPTDGPVCLTGDTISCVDDDGRPGLLSCDPLGVWDGLCVTLPPVCGNNILELPEECDDGNNTDGDACSAICEVEDHKEIKKGDLVISEIMTDPSAVKDEDGEWFEMYNNTSEELNLNGCEVFDDNSDSFKIKGDLIISAKSYIVLGRNDNKSENGDLSIDYKYTNFELANTEDEIFIECSDIEIDAVEYISSWPLFSNVSMILSDLSSDNNNADNWCLSSSSYGDGDLGTPKALNDACGNGPAPKCIDNTDCSSGQTCNSEFCELDGPNCTDKDGDGYAIEGGDCGIVDCDDYDDLVFDGCDNDGCKLELIKTAPDTVFAGGLITYNLSLENTGDDNCTGGGVRLKDEFDSNTTFVSSDTNLEKNKDSYVQWNFSTMEPGELEEVELVMELSGDVECGDEIINKSKYWSDQTDWGSYVSVSTLVECEEKTCEEGFVELLNPGFEEPHAGSWNVFPSSSVFWDVDWVNPYDGPGMLELQSIVQASEGNQYAELDTDHKSSNKDASVVISQEVDTFIGSEYILSFDFAPRAGWDETHNVLNVYINDIPMNTYVADGTDPSQVKWTSHSITFIADSEETKIAFADGGIPNTFGTFLDNVNLELNDCSPSFCGDGIVDESEQCDDGNNIDGDQCSSQCQFEYCGDEIVNQGWEECDGADDCTEMCTLIDDDSCSDLVLAQVNVGKFYNDGAGDMSDRVYIGSETYFVPNGTWFPLSWNGSKYLDSNIYEEVPGLAVQRVNGSLRTVMHTSLGRTDVEEVEGSVEFYNATVDEVRSDNSGNNKLEDSGVHADSVEINGSDDTLVDFYMWANTGDDGFYADWDIVEDCVLPGAYCGDGEINQAWEECDGSDDCTEMCTLIDDNTCSDLVLARVNVNEAKNFHALSNMSSDIYLGTSTGSIPAGSWFPLYLNGNYFLDDDIAGYEDVPGLAVQRLENDLRVVMYGTHSSGDKEHINGNIEFYNASVLDQRSDNSNDMPGNNRLENDLASTTEIGTLEYNAGNDEVWLEAGNTKQSFFWLTTTTADDGYFTGWSIDNECQESICGNKFNYYTEETIPDWTIYLKEKQECSVDDEWADEVISSDQNGSAVATSRSNPGSALGVAEDNDTINFYSLGMGGELILRFDNTIWNEAGNDLEVFETSFGSPDCTAYPEHVQVFASQNGVDWLELDTQCQDENLQFDLGTLEWATYVKLVDKSDLDYFVKGGDGFDVDGVRALNCYTWETVEETITDENGHYCFYDLEEGEYRVEEDTSDDNWTYSEYFYRDISYPFCQGNDTLRVASYDYLEQKYNCDVDFVNIPLNHCGDNNLDEGEACDDGNNVDGDGCSAECTLEYSSLEACVYIDEDGLEATTDDRNLASTSVWSFLLDSGLASTSLETVDGCFLVNVNPGTYHLEGEQATVWVPLLPATDYYDFVTTYGDSNVFKFVYYYEDTRDDEWCGDEAINGEEECDDGNNTNGDGCTEYCVIEVKKSSGGGSRSRIIIQEEVPLVLGEEGAPFLEIKIDPEFTQANPGDTNVKFTITVSNSGDIDAIDSVLDVVLPEGFSYNDPAVSGTWALGDIAPGEEVKIDIFLDISENADVQTYSIAASAKAANNPEVSAPANIELEEVIVLAETGFSFLEFFILLFALFASSASAMYLRKN